MIVTTALLRIRNPEAIERIKQSRTEPILTDVDRAKIKHFAQRYKDPEKQIARILQIIEMSSDGFRVSDIRREVSMGQGVVGETRPEICSYPQLSPIRPRSRSSTLA